MTTKRPAIVWFRRDLRLADNAALAAALAEDVPLLAVFVFDAADGNGRPPGTAARWWLHHSLRSLASALEARGSRLLLRQGRVEEVVPALAAAVDAGSVHWTGIPEPRAVAPEHRVLAGLKEMGVQGHVYGGTLLAETGSITTRAGGPVKVFSRFWQALCERGHPPLPVPAPACLPRPPAGAPAGEALAQLALLPTRPDWASGLREAWADGKDIGEPAARACLDEFLDSRLSSYAEGRDHPARQASSRLSPHLHWGEIGPRQVWHAALARQGWIRPTETFLRELAWRDFACCLLHHFSDMATVPLDARFSSFPWQRNEAAQLVWQRGRTGYPLVDAGMRELWQTGLMHNRVRMVAASFLVKHLMQPWQDGEAWFWETLVDADPANNPMNWQWVAGCGADAAPFFRIFNPVLQGEKFDSDGAYVRRWIPEIAGLPDKHLHAPWTAPETVLRSAGIDLGKTYPRPIVDHAVARARALAAFRSLPKAG